MDGLSKSAKSCAGTYPINKQKKGMKTMKKARKLITFILAAVMIMSMSLNVWADGETGTITIDGAIEDVTYSVYRILDLVSYNEETGAYSYKAAEGWGNFLRSQEINGTYIEIDNNEYVTWIGDEGNDTEDIKEFAAAALAYAKEAPVSANATDTISGNDENDSAEVVTVTFNNLPFGYYLVDSSQGALCSLDTINTTATIEEKNEAPEMDKKVDETATTNAVTIGEQVEFTVTITVKDGAQNYALHDTMSDGLTYNPNSLQIKIDENTTVDSEYYTHKYATETAPNNTEDGCTFEILFNDDYLATLDENTVITITYSAELNKNAVIGGAGNTNTAYLAYGEQPDTNGDGTPDGDTPKTPDITTTTYTYSFDLVKTDNNSKVLNGAKFELYDAETGGQKINLVYDAENGVYRVATQEETTEQDFVSEVITAGNVKIIGLGNGTYWLEETNPPVGYNPLSAREKVTIDNANLDATVNDGTYDNGGVQIINNTGSELPSTGGIGTTIFYIVGGVLVVFAVVLLVTKKRMKNEE